MSAEKDKITASFASSDGWSVRPPTPSQRLEPLAFTPMTGTSIKSTSVKPRKAKAQRRYTAIGTREAKSIAAMPSRAKTSCRTK